MCIFFIVIWHDKEDAVVEVLEDKLKSLQPDINIVIEKKSDLTESLKKYSSLFSMDF
ncbi:hypothetical protein [Butyrivibrio sp. WCE2006]|uniref:hypothetical protein n=1 Tax=Butyrivibrio sp. WCE2006 TaxID=1410611 RepID=UPI000ABE7BF4